MAGKIENASRGNIYSIFPENLVLVKEPGHPLFDPRVLELADEALVRNIMVHGVLQPVHITRNGDDQEVVDGRHRVIAAIEANKRLEQEGKAKIKVKVLQVSGQDKDIFGVMVSANEHRKADEMLNKANKAKKMLDMGATIDEVAINFGVTTKAIRNWMALNDLDNNVRAAVLEGRMTSSAALELAPLHRADQVEAMNKLLAQSGEKQPTIKQAKEIKEQVKPSAKPRTKKTAYGGEAQCKDDTRKKKTADAALEHMGYMRDGDSPLSTIVDVLQIVKQHREDPWEKRHPALLAVAIDASDPFVTATRAFEAGLLVAARVKEKPRGDNNPQ